jgi:cyclopropane-fatty-acyl-phospholipid synthase|tara:strand:+ start:236 stop:1423 length:1188 start_codon:yes stop_codon:yes gene_type:complete
MTFAFLKFLLTKFITSKSILIQFEGREHLIDNNTEALVLKINNKKFLVKLFYAPSLVLTEGYMDKDYELTNSSFYEFTELLIDNYNLYLEKFSRTFFSRLFLIINPLFQLNFSKISKSNVASHYDLSDKLYDLFLDKTRQYSCAYFESEKDSLYQAQMNKMDRLADKLHLKKGDNVLDIGCGWGSLSRHFNSEYGCNVKGISLSEEQISYCLKKQKSSKNSKDLEYSLQDYRNETNHYDKIVSVGMFEHVGKPFYNTYFKKVNDLLSDDGIAVIHTIGNVRTPKLTPAFIRKYIFPGGYIPSLSEIMPAVEKSGLIISDIEVLRLHYADTLRNWYKNFQKSEKQVLDLYDERFIRMWESYLNLSEISFRKGDNVVYQLVLTKKRDTFPIVRKRIN